MEEYSLHISKRLIALGATSAIIISACSSSTATTAPTAAATAAPTAAASVAASTAPAASAAASAAASPAASQNTNWVACVAFDTGGLGDKGFNDLAKAGLDKVGAMGMTTHYSEAKGSTDYAANIQRLIDQGCQSIITVGFNQAQATVDAVKKNPKIDFGQVDTTWDTTTNGPVPANFTGLDFQIDQAAMLAGYLVGGWSKSGIMGTYGGQQFPGVTRFMDGYYAGIKYWDQEKSAKVKLLGWDASTQTGTFVNGDNPWGDAAKGEQLAGTFVDQGADVVGPVAGSTGNGSIKYMMFKGLWAIGVDTDQALSLPQYAAAILTSAQKAIDNAVIDTFKANANGVTGGANYEGTLANNGVLLAPFHNFDSQISPDLKAGISALQAKLIDGSVKVSDYLK
jgi:basic membrane protein A and related proteins